MRAKDRGILFLCLLLFSIAASAFARTAPILPTGDNVWFATEYGLYRYDKAQDEWSAFSAGSGLAGNDVRDIGIDEGIVWVATDGGVGNSDVRFGDWRSYTANDGLPSDDAKCIAFSEDYVWIGTDGGAARFDKLLEEWEGYTEADGLAGDQVNDIVVDDEIVWFATSNGVSRFDAEFDKWTNYHEAELPSANVTWALALGEYVWFVTDRGLARYDKRLKSWKSYSTADGIVSYLINDVVIDGESIWLATEDGVSSYDPISDSWSPGLVYHTVLPSKNVTDLAVDGDVIWFCTDNGVSSYDSETGSWRHYTTADGLLDNRGQGIAVSGQVFVVTERGVNLYDKKLQEWDTHEFSEGIAGEVGEVRRERGLKLDERGIGFDLSRETQVRLSGLSSLEFVDVSSLRPERHDEYEWNAENDLSLGGNIPGERSVVGFYDDTEEDNVEYGLTYRGNDTDVLQEATGGEFEVRMRNSELIEDINLVGAGARLREDFDGARLNIEPRYGQQRGYFETDFLTYRTGTSIYELSHQNVIPETDEVSVDKERLQRGVDYLIVYPTGWMMFHREELVEEGGEIEVRYQYEPTDDVGAVPPCLPDRHIAILTTGFDLGDDYYTGLDMLHADDIDVVSLNAEGKDMNVGPVSMKLRPEIAYSTGRSAPATMDSIASKAELIANAPRTQFKADYEGYGDDFQTIGRRETRFGELDRHLGLFSQVDMTQWLPLTLRWQQNRSSDDDMVPTSEEDAKMNIVLSKKPYPIVAVTGERNTVSSSKQEETENAARADFQYDLPESLLSRVKFRRAEVNGYYREAHRRSNVEHAASLLNADESGRTRTGYAKLNLYPMEQFVVSTSYRLNRAEEEADSELYRLREELQRLLIRSNFSSIDGVMSTLHLDDLSFRSRSAAGDLVEDRDRYFAASLNLLPGAWTRRLEMLTAAGRYSMIQQTVPVHVEGSSPESEEVEQADGNSRSLRLQMNLRPHGAVSWTGTYQRVKSWIDGTPPVGNIYKYRSEAEFKPDSKHRIMLEYSQEHEDEDSSLLKRLYSPSLWWETRWSQSWTTRLRSVYQRSSTREEGEVLEIGSTLTPSLSFRYTARELPYNGRLYLSQGFSISVYRAERDMRDLASETYSTSFVTEWKITRNLSLRLRASLSYKDHAQGGSDEGSANIYARTAARF
jgi:ligand-binding sensor domain-containing protein